MKSTAQLRVGVLLILIVVGLVSSLGTAWHTGDWEGLFLNLGTEMLGAVATYVLLELFIGGRERREAKKAALIAQMGSSVKDVAIAAAEELRRHGWLTDGSLRGAFLPQADLQRAYLSGADFQRANLAGTKLQGAHLSGVNLQGAWLEGTNLQKAGLFDANLQRAWLEGTDLRGALLTWANLQGAHSWGVLLDESTILPDETKWTPGTDMARFTDPDHPDFWRPDA